VQWSWKEIGKLPPPLAIFFGANYALALVRDALVYALVLGVAVACLVVGSTTGRYVGAVFLIGWLLLGWLLLAVGLARRHILRRYVR
jgi:hypothetical protein